MRSDYVPAHTARGELLVRRNRTQEAIQVFRYTITLEPNNPDLHYNVTSLAICETAFILLI